MSTSRRLGTLAGLVGVVVILCASCVYEPPPVGVRSTSGQVEIFVYRCGASADVPVAIELAPSSLNGTTTPSWPVVWTGTLSRGQESMVVPIALDETARYGVTAAVDGGNQSGEFRLASQNGDRVSVSNNGRPARQMTVDEWRSLAKSRCPTDWVRNLGLIVVGTASLAFLGLVVSIFFVVLAYRRRRVPPPDPRSASIT